MSTGIRKRKPSKKDFRLVGGPFNGASVPLATGHTLPFRVRSHSASHGRYMPTGNDRELYWAPVE